MKTKTFFILLFILLAAIALGVFLSGCSHWDASNTTYDDKGKPLNTIHASSTNVAVFRKVGSVDIPGLGSVKNVESDPKVEAVTQVAERVTAAAVKAAKTP